MIDPASIAGLSFAIFDQLLRLGERTAQLIADARSFDEDTSSLVNKLNDENTRTRQLRTLLFENSPVYNGTLFEQFDEDVQVQIKIFLGQLVGILEEGFKLLQSRYPPSTPDPSASSSSINLLFSSKPRRSPFQVLRWSFHDKKRAEVILNNFSDTNQRIHENIKLWILASDMGVEGRHLQHLRSDPSSIILGFDIDATLRMTAENAQIFPETLELPENPWGQVLGARAKLDEGFAIFEWEKKSYLQETRYYEPIQAQFGDEKIDPRTVDRVDKLAKLLHQPKEQVFLIPRCIGWKYVPVHQNIAFVFEVPNGVRPESRCLLRVISDGDVKPTLGDKFRLAFGLSRCIAQLQMVKWVHESFRSDKILFFPPADPSDPRQKCQPEIDFSKPWVLGFDFSRPETDFSGGQADTRIEHEIYRHPERQGFPSRPFNKLHDIYALGVVLLEVGLWEPAITLEKARFAHARDPFRIRAQLQKHAEHRLGSKVGDKYKQVVSKCLTGDFGVKDDTKDDLKLQQAFRIQVVDVLEKAAGNV